MNYELEETLCLFGPKTLSMQILTGFVRNSY